MNYPSIIEYIDSIEAGGELFSSLGSPCLVYDQQGEPVYSSGNFGVVFRVQRGEHTAALKCFTREQHGREAAYRKIAAEMPKNSPYIVHHDYFSDEISVLLSGGRLSQFPVLVMDWVEGRTLEQTIVDCISRGDRATLAALSAEFDRMALWLLGSGIAHGDLKPENIIVTPDGGLKLVDYDGVYTPSMRGEDQREVGTEGCQHPLRSTMAFSPEIDHYPMALISFTLRVLAWSTDIYGMFGGGIGSTTASGVLLFDPSELIAGHSAAYNFIIDTPFSKSALYAMLESSQPVLEGLEDALREPLTRHEMQLTPFERNGLWGFCDLGDTELAPIYDRVLPFCEGYAAVAVRDRWGYVDTRGELLCGFRFDDAWSFSQGLALIRWRGKYGFIDTEGRRAIAARYSFARSFSNGVAVAAVDGRYGFIDRSGRWVIKPQYDYAESMRRGRAKVEKDGREFYVTLPTLE